MNAPHVSHPAEHRLIVELQPLQLCTIAVESPISSKSHFVVPPWICLSERKREAGFNVTGESLSGKPLMLSTQNYVMSQRAGATMPLTFPSGERPRPPASLAPPLDRLFCPANIWKDIATVFWASGYKQRANYTGTNWSCHAAGEPLSSQNAM